MRYGNGKIVSHLIQLISQLLARLLGILCEAKASALAIQGKGEGPCLGGRSFKQGAVGGFVVENHIRNVCEFI